VYEPPYLFDASDQPYAARPVMTTVPSTVTYGQTFLVNVDNASVLTSACLMRPGGVTHQRNFDQLYVPLTIVPINSTTVMFTAPTNPNSAPAGDYLLFVVKTDAGRQYPSVARWVRLAHNTVPQIFASSEPGTGQISVSWTALFNQNCATENLHRVEYDL